MLTLAEAAQRVGKSKPTLQRAIKAGRLSAGRDQTGAYRIDPAELARVYPAELGRVYPEAGPPAGTWLEEASAVDQLADFARHIEVLEAKLAMAVDERDYLRERIISFERTANQTLSLLADKRTARDEPDDLWPLVPRSHGRPGFLRRLFGQGGT